MTQPDTTGYLNLFHRYNIFQFANNNLESIFIILLIFKLYSYKMKKLWFAKLSLL